jgi:methylglutaconyl-CoA hydratase
LAAVCDILVAAETANFCLSEARLGLLPATISPYVLRALGERACQRYLLSAERFSAAEAQRLGFVHQLCAPADLDAQVQTLATTLAANGPAATRACKRLIRELSGQELTNELRADTARRIADIRCSPEGREGIAAFLGKRPPNWLPAPDTPAA